MIGGVGVVVLVGRPNVGKSALFNRVVGAQRAIVDDVPGVTRDRLVAVASHRGRRFLCIDTGGFHAEPERAGALAARVRDTALAAVEDADVIVCVVDGQTGALPDDTALIRLLARTGKPLVVAVNKLDVPSQDLQAADFYGAGTDEVVGVSAAHRRGLDQLLDLVTAKLPEAPAEPPDAAGALRVALVGRPNVGKSSLLNRLAGEPRALVSPEPGTTRDVVDTRLTIEGRPYVLLDTAGIRRRGRITDRIERHGAVRALAALERADVVLLVLDATEGMTDQDARLAGRALEAGRGVLLVANKWDLVPEAARAALRRRGALAGSHQGLADLPVVAVSAVTGEGMGQLFQALWRVERSYDRTFQTAALNRALHDAAREHEPASARGRAVRLFYATQTGRRPPEVTLFVNEPAAVSAAYRRYLANRLARVFGLSGVAVRIVCRRRRPERGRQPRR
ncbi:MAG TPA: ribosome biogenesis GTPase Der [Candidatus Limnocylindria bacterium]|nr:ribosome biogenesis GTPase Der [Candidatus Limnocylindria bacterium]